METVDPTSRLADEVSGSKFVAIEMRVDFDLWHSPIQQLGSMSIWHIQSALKGEHTRHPGRTWGHQLVDKRAMCIDGFHRDNLVGRSAPALSERGGGWNNRHERGKRH